MQAPYIYTTPPVAVRQIAGFDNERGLIVQEVQAEHAIWAARVPFLPAMISDDFTRMGRERLPLIRARQFRFIYDLARARDHHTTFELRLIATPNPIPGLPNQIDVVFLGKALSRKQRSAHSLALHLWEHFISVFPLEEPFNYPLEPITSSQAFLTYYEPLPFDQLEPSGLLEIRKYEDMPARNQTTFGRGEQIGDYVAHPFVPNVDFSAMGRFLTALADQPTPCYVSISLRPTRLFDQEIRNISSMVGRFRDIINNNQGFSEEYIRTRAQIGAYVYQQLTLEREQLATIRISVVSEQEPLYGLAEALGSELMGNADNKYPTQWKLERPSQADFPQTLHNLRYLEHDHWGDTLADPRLQRLRYLVTAQEAYGAFRLPIPPESGYLPGMLVRSEPFVAPADELEQRQSGLGTPTAHPTARKVSLGQIYHRGRPTAQQFLINVSDLTRHALIAGSTGSGKSTTLRHLLAQLWTEHRVPFLVLYPLDKPDYRELRGFQRLSPDLLFFTLGDENTSPFRFNPFEVPDGLLLKTHISRLMRVFQAAFSLHDPLPMIYREALRRVYTQRGWDVVKGQGEAGRDYPIMTEFLEAIRGVTTGLSYGREVQDNVRQASVIRIADLIANAGHVINVRRSMAFEQVLQRPTVIELGRVGAMQDTALLMGFLLVRFAEELERSPRPLHAPHITVVEEAHRLMAESGPAVEGTGNTRGAVGEDFSNLLAEVRGFGEGILIAEQIPTLLVKGAIGNTYLKLMHWLEDPPSFELFGTVMNLNEAQRNHARTLTAGFAIVRSPFGWPVHIKVPSHTELPDFSEEASKYTKDQHIKAFMGGQRNKLGITDVAVEPWPDDLLSEPAKQSQAPPQTNVRQIAQRLLRAPMQSCAFCRPLLERENCPFRAQMLKLHKDNLTDQQRAELASAIAVEDRNARWAVIRKIIQTYQITDTDQAYCFLAHASERSMNQKNGSINRVVRQQYRRVLDESHTHLEEE